MTELFNDVERNTNYSVSNYGRVFSKLSGIQLAPFCVGRGYLAVDLQGVTVLVHILVADSFIPKEEDLDTINHIDEDKTNNNLSNLERMSRGDNAAYTLAKSYTFLSPDGSIVKVHNLNKFCRENGLHDGHMSQVAKGKHKSHKKWRLYGTN